MVVGIGASAGGLDAFRGFFSNMPSDAGMSFVLVQHLDPRHESSLVAIVGGYTAMPVLLAEHGTSLLPNHVYVIPPDSILTLKNSVLLVNKPAETAARRMSINTFLISLAEDQGENAVGIILAGFGSDGALGVAAIKEHGGLTLSQAEFDHHAKSGMPQSAAMGGFVDHVLAVGDMPAALLDYQRRRAAYDAAKGPDGIRQDLPRYLSTIAAVLHSRLGRDFSQYKSGTLMRRVQRRMQVLQTDNVPAYIEELRRRPDEPELLFRELLIGVTRFFRDPDAFAGLDEAVIATLTGSGRSDDPIRLWIPGCATGEEAYSIAILIQESLERSGSRRVVQVFATDIDDRAIATARSGLYPGTIASDVSAERLERNFVEENGKYRVTKNLRDTVLFSTHDIARDPPFSRLDLISCRNVLIYFQPHLQQQVLSTFHYALRPGGHLFLGPSESVFARSRLFAAIDKRYRIYVRRDAEVRIPVVSPRVSRPLPAKMHTAAGESIERVAARALARFAPAFLIVDSHHEVVRFSGQTSGYIEPATGIANLNLFSLLHRDLRVAARAALKQAATGVRVVEEAVSYQIGEDRHVVNLIVEPLSDPLEAGLFLIAFDEVRASPGPRRPAPSHEDAAETAVQSLEGELVAARERLRNVGEELEAANEELQSSNEEYLSVNEELSSANEELETSREELQSLNEELQTINAELNHRNENLVRSNSDLANLFDSTAIATLFLDNELRIRRFTPRVLEIFNLREGDEGRPITDIVTHLVRDRIGKDVGEVLRTLVPMEREVTVAAGSESYLMQVRPYRDVNNTIDGAVVSFIDISDRKLHERARSLLAAIVDSSQDAVISHDLAGTVTSWNDGARDLFGYASAEAIGRPLSILLGAPPSGWDEVLSRLEKGERIARYDGTGTTKEGTSIDLAVTISPIREIDGRIVGASVVARDIGERRAAEAKAALLLGELDHRVKNILAIVSAVIAQTLKTNPDPEGFAAEVTGRVRSIATAHSLLTEAGHGQMSFRAVLATELAPFDRNKSNIAMTGPDIVLTPRAGLALAMALHELASNAAKYGALSVSSGQLAVTWEIASEAGGSAFELIWSETGGPPVLPPSRRGFGTTLIERALTHELDADVKREFLPGGVRCTIVFRLTGETGRLASVTAAGTPG